MFEIVGREEQVFEQWEQGAKVTNPCMKAGDEVVFRNASGATAVMIAREESGQVVCDVPNKLLQMCCNILVDLEQGRDQHSDCQTVFAVNPAEKPADYVYIDNTVREEVKPSGGGVSSWNDLTDKPFYEEISVIAEAEKVYLNPEGAEEDLIVFGELPLNGGDTILVTFCDSFVPLDSGEVYECKCVELDGVVTAGNLANWGMVGNADAPFMLIYGPGFGTAIMPLKLSGINTYNIRIKKVVRKEIEPKFLPRFIVTCDTEDGTTYTADKTHQEIVDAYKAGYIVTAKVKYYGTGWYVDCVPSMIGGSMASFYGIAGGILFTATTQNLGSGQNDIVEVEQNALFGK